ncbi:unnamed protein product [Mytilus coruscus]|uniref:Uncharacterized protein n=1 Tax=Mytilus coruscus TaxID=42192 RepID=A0A6J8AHB0_MYTCO|nr:unnamed protein product [Mytilus coruscus]
MLSELAFSGRHMEQSVWVISQRYNSVLKDLREQTKWLCMFYTKDRDSFDNCLRENDVIPTLEERQRIKEELKKKKHHLEEDPFINNALTNTCCELYYRYGMYLAPFTAILTTARHIEPLLRSISEKDENNDIKMMNENPEQKENKEEKKEVFSERSERSPFKKPKPKDPKRVAAGKKGAEGIACRSNKMASALAMMLGGAITNAFCIFGSNYLFSHMGSNANEEKIRHDKAIEKLEKSTSRLE